MFETLFKIMAIVRTRLLFLCVLSVCVLSHAMFSAGGGGGSCGGAPAGGTCGGGPPAGGCGAGGPEPEVDTSNVPPTNVLIMFAGKSYAGKDFLGSRLLALLQAHQHFNVTSHKYAFGDQWKKLFAEEKNLDYVKLLHDWDYRDEHWDAMSTWNTAFKERTDIEPSMFPRMVTEEMKQHALPMGRPYERVSFVLTDLKREHELTYMKKVAADNVISHLKVITVRVEASEDARKRRGWKAGPSASSPDQTELDNHKGWTYTFHNEDEGEDSVAAIDKFLANKILPVCFSHNLPSN